MKRKNKSLLVLLLLLSIVFSISAQTPEGLKIPERVNSSDQPLDIKSKADELGITAEQLNGILNSVEKSSGEGGGDPFPDAMQERFFTGQAAGDQFGYSVSNAGDVNGDGYDDIIVGARKSSSAQGKAYLYLGGLVTNSVPDAIFSGISNGSEFGSSVSSAGDVNADGFDDIIIGAPYEDGFFGRATIIFGNAIMTTYSVLDIYDPEPNLFDFFGTSVSGAGDVNGDGFSDVIIGSPYHDHWSPDQGNAYIYFGGSAMNANPDVQLLPDGGGTGGEFGGNVSKAGDVNGDGYADVIVGAPADGLVSLYFGGASMNNLADFTVFGRNGSFAGDVNGDGYSDFIIGA